PWKVRGWTSQRRCRRRGGPEPADRRKRAHLKEVDRDMMRSMFAGVSGLRNHQTRMDVIGNNIANVNTVGFKASRVNFRQMFSQTLRGASRPTNDRGGTNPMQIGLGAILGSITPTFTPGNVQTTGSETDLA